MVAWLACIAAVSLACHEKAPPDSANAPAAAAAAGSSDSCEQFVSQLCGRSGGDESALCTSAKELGKVLPASACVAAIKDFPQVEHQIDVDRKPCTDLAERLCKDLGPDTSTCAMVKEQTPQFPREHCEQLAGSYEQVLPELQKQEAMNQPLTPEAQAKIAGKGAPGFGPENAKVTIVEFSDFQCPYCAQAHETVHQLRERYPDQVRIVFRHFPLAFHEHARLAAQAALAAHAQGKFWPYHDRLFEHQNALDRKSLEGYAQDLGLDVAAFKKGLDDNAFDAQLEADVSLGKSVRVDGTPTMFINGRRAENATEIDAVAPLIDAALAAK
jgi:protein-disulfide isomerase